MTREEAIKARDEARADLDYVLGTTYCADPSQKRVDWRTACTNVFLSEILIQLMDRDSHDA